MNAPAATPPDAPTPPSPPPSALQEISVNLIDHPGLWMDEAVNELTIALKTFLPNLLGGMALLLLGWLVAYVVADVKARLSAADLAGIGW